MLELTWKQVAAWRSHRHHLDQRAPAGSMLAVASRLCGLHAQVMSSAELTLWARVQGLEQAAVRRALWEERTLIKTWAMRGTLHLLPSDELPMWHAALGTTGRYLRPAAWQNYYGISIEELDRLTEAVACALSGRVLTREELMREVGRLLGPAFGKKILESSWGTILKPAAFAGNLCFGPSLGQRVRFTRPDTWLAVAPASVDPQSALTAIARRYLGAYGPVTCRDLARWWNGGGIAAARRWIASLGEEVRAVEIDGEPAWMLESHARDLREHTPVPSVRLLPGFDQYVVAASCHAEHLLPGIPRIRIYRPQGWISPVLLVNGRMEGVWRHEIKGSRVDVVIEPFRKPPQRVRKAAGQEAERLATFVGGSLKLQWKG